MIFKNNIYIIVMVFIVTIGFQYYRYRRIAIGKINISGLLLLKILIRSLILILFLILSNFYFHFTFKQDVSLPKAIFVVQSTKIENFSLSEDDAINILTRIGESKFSQIELLVYDLRNKKFHVYIPSTSETTFSHLLKIERARKVALPEIHNAFKVDITPLNHIELYHLEGQQWKLSDSNQEDFNLLHLLDEDNELISSNMLHYLLFLILFLLTIDLGLKYRILKI